MRKERFTYSKDTPLTIITGSDADKLAAEGIKPIPTDEEESEGESGPSK